MSNSIHPSTRSSNFIIQMRDTSQCGNTRRDLPRVKMTASEPKRRTQSASKSQAMTNLLKHRQKDSPSKESQREHQQRVPQQLSTSSINKMHRRRNNHNNNNNIRKRPSNNNWKQEDHSE